ncbi:unnamed protein product [Rotaria sp. Silwood1]|nr:unnamed protein product [Rotaria sp. Silwood1]
MFFFYYLVSNIIFNLNAQYIGTPDITTNITAVLKHSLELKCEYKGVDGNGQFVGWYKDGVAVSTEKPGHYAVIHTETHSILTIRIFDKN